MANREFMRKDIGFLWELEQIKSGGPNWRENLQAGAAPAQGGELATGGSGGGSGPAMPPAFGPAPAAGGASEAGAPAGEPTAPGSEAAAGAAPATGQPTA